MNKKQAIGLCNCKCGNCEITNTTNVNLTAITENT